ncbi:hypothetical protein F4780DRAFT_613478 [Xylariomycetidae sp. FL0641]|nr:hypothetical protein F4780DRAFT_613478 [Xylariomycetidae sp. FL0641]
MHEPSSTLCGAGSQVRAGHQESLFLFLFLPPLSICYPASVLSRRDVPYRRPPPAAHCLALLPLRLSRANDADSASRFRHAQKPPRRAGPASVEVLRGRVASLRVAKLAWLVSLVALGPCSPCSVRQSTLLVLWLVLTTLLALWHVGIASLYFLIITYPSLNISLQAEVCEQAGPIPSQQPAPPQSCSPVRLGAPP